MTPSPPFPPGLARLNSIAPPEARSALLSCCGSSRWAAGMLDNRPYAGLDSLLRVADTIWFALSPADWQEAFSHHPRIGETNLSQPRFASTAEQSAREQSGMAGASGQVRAAFAAGNAEYEKKFGHVFLICATGKSGDFMLEQLRTRLANNAQAELYNAAREHSLITRIRLTKLVNS